MKPIPWPQCRGPQQLGLLLGRLALFLGVLCYIPRMGQAQTVSDPSFSPASGTLVPVNVRITSATPDAVVRYTLDGSVPTATSPAFVTNLVFTNLTMVRARAFKTGMTDSGTTYAYYAEPGTRTDVGYYRAVTNDAGQFQPLISVTLNGASNVTCFTIEERLPSAVTPVNITGGGQWLPALDVVRWGPYTNVPSVTVSYRITGIPGSYGVGGVAWADGRWKFEPSDSMATILGAPDATVPTAPVQVATPVITPLAIQAESAAYGGGVSLVTTNAGYHGGGFAGFPLANGYLQFNSVNGGEGGDANLCIRFANGGSSVRTGRLIVNGLTNSITFNPTGNWTSWSSVTNRITLKSGAVNIVRLEPGGQGLPSVDEITVMADNPAAPLQIVLTCMTPGALIYYTLDGTVPTTASFLYTAAISLTDAAVVRARAFKEGFLSSVTAVANYAATPTAGAATLTRSILTNVPWAPMMNISSVPGTGSVCQAFEETVASGLLISNVNNGGIWSNGVVRWGPFFDTNNQTFTYQALGPAGSYAVSGRWSRDGEGVDLGQTSLVVADTGSILIVPVAPSQLPAPVLVPAQVATLPMSVTVTSAVAPAQIRYTVDGSTPSGSSPLYVGPLNFTSNTTLRARAFLSGWLPSDAVVGYYGAATNSAGTWLEVVRTISQNSNTTPLITLTATPHGTISAYTVLEALPPELTPSDLIRNPMWNPTNRSLKWGPFSNEVVVMSYRVSGSGGFFVCDGQASVDGYPAAVTGQSNLTVIGSGGVSIPATPVKLPRPLLEPKNSMTLPVNVAAFSAVGGAQLRYTLDGSVPTPVSALYTSTLQFSNLTTLRVRAFLSGWEPSDAAVGYYEPAASTNILAISRSITNSPGYAPRIKLTATPAGSPSAYTVIESVPYGVTPFNISSEGLWSVTERTLKWGPFTNEARTLNYQLSGMAGTNLLDGVGSIDGFPVGVTGQTNVVIDLALMTNPAAPAIIVQPLSQLVVMGADLVLYVDAVAAPTPQYQWRKDGVAISGATSQVYARANFQAVDAGVYDVVVSNNVGFVTSQSAVITTVGPPTIVSQPQPQVVVAGTNITFSIVTMGAPATGFQWKRNGTNLTINARTMGVLSNILTISAVMAADAGAYSVSVWNDYGSTNSQPAALTVIPANPTLTWLEPSPIVYGTPLGASQLNAIASVPGTFAYTPGAGIALNVGTNLLFAKFTPTDTANYASVTTEVNLIVTRASLSVNVLDATRSYGSNNPVFTGAISGLRNGDTITAFYSCSATPFSPPGTYPIIPSLVDSGARLENYSVFSTNGALTVTSPTVLIVANGSFENGLAGWSYEGSRTITASSVNPPPIPDGSGEAGDATELVLLRGIPSTFDTDVSAPNGTGFALIANAGDQRTATRVSQTLYVPSNPGLLWFNYRFMTDEYDSGPANNDTFAVQLNSNTVVRLTRDDLQSNGTGPLVGSALLGVGGYAMGTPWLRTNIDMSPYAGQAVTLSFVVWDTADASWDSAAAVNGVSGGSASPALVSQPTNQTVLAGGQAVFSVQAVGAMPLGYRWKYNSANLTDSGRVSGSQSNVLTITGLLASDAGLYSVVVTNTSGNTNSQSAILTVLPASPMLAWAEPSSIIYGNPLGADQLNATSRVPGTFVYTPALGSVLDAGTNFLTVKFTPTDPANYAGATGVVRLVVTSAPLSVSAANASRAYGATNPTFTGNLTGLRNGDKISVTFGCSATQFSPPGSYSIIPSLVDPANRLSNYSIDSASGVLTVTVPEVLVIANGGFENGLSGWVTEGSQIITSSAFYPPPISGGSGELGYATNLTLLRGSPSTPESDVSPNEGSGFALIANTGDQRTATRFSQTLYMPNRESLLWFNFRFMTDEFDSGPANEDAFAVQVNNNTALRFTRDDLQKSGTGPLLGVGLPGVGGYIMGTPWLRTNIDLSAYAGQTVTLSFVVWDAADSSWDSAVAIDGVAGGSASPVLVNQPTNQTVVAGSQAIFSLQSVGAMPLVYQWKCNSTNLSDSARVSGTHSNVLSITGISASDAGIYSVVVTNGSGSTNCQAELTVLRGTPILTWSAPAPVVYGTSLGTAQLNANANVPGALSYDPPTGAVLDAGAHVLTVVFGAADSASYYSVTSSVNLTVSPAPLAVTADTYTRVYGATNPVFTGNITGEKVGDGLSVTFNCGATPASLPGLYPIIPAIMDPNTRLQNYTVTLNNGVLTVTPAAPPTIASITPTSGTTNGGTLVTITGAGFQEGARVGFGALASPMVTYSNASTLVAVTPSASAGSVDVVVTNADTQIFVRSNAFSYIVPFTNVAAGDVLAIDSVSGNVLRYRPSSQSFFVLTNVGPNYNGMTVGNGKYAEYAWVAGQIPSSILKINLTNGVVTPFASGLTYFTVAYHEGFVYATSTRSSSIYVYDAGTGILSHQWNSGLSGGYSGIAWDVGQQQFVLAAYGGGRLDSMSTNGVFKTLVQGSGNPGTNQIFLPHFVSCEASGQYLVAYNSANNSRIQRVFIGATNTVLTIAESLNQPLSAVSDGAGRIYLGNGDSGTLRVMKNDGTALEVLTGPGAPSGGKLSSVVIVEPAREPALRLQLVARVGSRLDFSWAAIVGRTYQLQYTTNLLEHVWSPLTTSTMTSSIGVGSDSVAPDGPRFYRLVLLP